MTDIEDDREVAALIEKKRGMLQAVVEKDGLRILTQFVKSPAPVPKILDTIFGANEWADKLYANRMLENAVQEGDDLPLTEVTLVDGRVLNLSELYATKPLLLYFHRGFWCSMCVGELEFAMQEHALIERLGVHMVHIICAAPGQIKDRFPDGTPFDFACDENCELAEKMRITHQYFSTDRAVEDAAEVEYNMAPRMAVNGVFMINRQGKVCWRSFLETSDFLDFADIGKVVQEMALADRRHMRRSSTAGSSIISFEDVMPNAMSLNRFHTSPRFNCILRNHTLLIAFSTYLNTIGVASLLQFFGRVRGYVSDYTSKDKAQRQQLGRDLVDRFIVKTSPHALPIDPQLRERLLENIAASDNKKFRVDTFDEVVSEVMERIERHITDWQRTRHFNQVWMEADSPADLHIPPIPPYATKMSRATFTMIVRLMRAFSCCM